MARKGGLANFGNKRAPLFKKGGGRVRQAPKGRPMRGGGNASS